LFCVAPHGAAPAVMAKSHVLKPNRKPKILSRAHDAGIPERKRGGQAKTTKEEAEEEEKKKAYKRPRPGRPVHFNDTQKRDYICGFAKRKQERREKAAAKAKEEELAERKEIKKAHMETIEEQYQDSLKAAKVSQENVERAAEMKRIEAKAKRLESNPEGAGGDAESEEAQSSGSEVDLGNVEQIESILPPVQVLESSDEEDGGRYTVETSFTMEEEQPKKKGRTTLADLGIELTIRQKERIQKQINARKRDEARKDAKKKKKYKGAKFDKLHKKKKAGAKKKTLAKASKKSKK